MPTEPDLQIGKIVNHTHRLDIGGIRQIVTERVLAEIGEGVVERVEPIHVAPADDSKLMTKAARAWRDASGEELEFTDDLAGGLYWFGCRYTLRDASPGSTDEDVPSRWPPEGLESPDDEAVNPQVAEAIREELDEEGSEGSGR